MGRVEGKVAFITGAARGQGRSHALRLAEEGADIIAVDIVDPVATSWARTATAEDMAETVKLVEDLDRRIVARTADVRDLGALRGVVAEGVAALGRLDIVSANAGIGHSGPALELTEDQWQEMIDINLTGVWKTVMATAPAMIEAGNGGAIVLTSSAAGLVALPGLSHYTAAKHGVVGLMRSFAVELAPHNIRVNSVHPTTVDTPMIDNEVGYQIFTGIEGADRATAERESVRMNALKVPWVEVADISNALLYLVSDDGRHVTGNTHVIGAGVEFPFKIPHA